MVIKERDPFLWLAPHLDGDEASYQEYAKRLMTKLKRYFASNRCEAADDLASESLLRLTNKLAIAEPEGPDSEDARTRFLFGIARNVLAEWRRRKSNRELVLSDDDRPEFSLPPVDLVATECLELLRQTVSRSLAQLSPMDRELITQTILNTDYRLTLAAMAKEKGIPAPTMRQRGRRTRVRFEEMLRASDRIDDLFRCLGLKRVTE